MQIDEFQGMDQYEMKSRPAIPVEDCAEAVRRFAMIFIHYHWKLNGSGRILALIVVLDPLRLAQGAMIALRLLGGDRQGWDMDQAINFFITQSSTRTSRDKPFYYFIRRDPLLFSRNSAPMKSEKTA